VDDTTTQKMIKNFYETAIDDVVGSSEIYADDAVLEFPQGRELIRSRANIVALRSAYPARVTIDVHRTIGRQDLWLNEFTIRYNDTNPFNGVSIMEFHDGKIVRERIYYGEPWEAPAWRAQWVEPMM
jgi:hypothetical protein